MCMQAWSRADMLGELNSTDAGLRTCNEEEEEPMQAISSSLQNYSGVLCIFHALRGDPTGNGAPAGTGAGAVFAPLRLSGPRRGGDGAWRGGDGDHSPGPAPPRCRGESKGTNH
ncbi:hypothetical protein EJB05_09742, partial [Eragrostis curvula]